MAAAVVVPLEPAAARALWSDVGRWPSFVEGLARVAQVSPGWPEPGAKVVWESGPGGRGRVTEKVLEAAEDRFATELFEERLLGTQRAEFRREQAGGTRLELELSYRLARGGALEAITDTLFVRRALRDSLERTLRRFAVEAEDEAGLR